MLELSRYRHCCESFGFFEAEKEFNSLAQPYSQPRLASSFGNSSLGPHQPCEASGGALNSPEEISTQLNSKSQTL